MVQTFYLLRNDPYSVTLFTKQKKSNLKISLRLLTNYRLGNFKECLREAHRIIWNNGIVSPNLHFLVVACLVKLKDYNSAFDICELMTETLEEVKGTCPQLFSKVKSVKLEIEFEVLSERCIQMKYENLESISQLLSVSYNPTVIFRVCQGLLIKGIHKEFQKMVELAKSQLLEDV